MNTITVNRKDLIQTLHTNREQHRAKFLEAIDAYRKLAIRELDKMLTEAKAGKKIRRKVELVEPADHTADYDRVIGMMDWEVRDEVELDSLQFAQYVQDDWGWKQQFAYSYTANTGKGYE